MLLTQKSLDFMYIMYSEIFGKFDFLTFRSTYMYMDESNVSKFIFSLYSYSGFAMMNLVQCSVQ
jgi:hypothetical protein